MSEAKALFFFNYIYYPVKKALFFVPYGALYRGGHLEPRILRQDFLWPLRGAYFELGDGNGRNRRHFVRTRVSYLCFWCSLLI